nr:STM3941 family protein [uncultured Draconibacterium sp.]
MTEIKLYKSPWKALKLLGLTIPLIAVGIWLILRAESSLLDRIMGWIGVPFFGFGFFLAFFHLFDRRHQIIINTNGIWDRTTKQDFISWNLIKNAKPLNIFGQKFISLTMDKSFKSRNKQYSWARKLSKEVGSSGLDLQLSQIKINPMTMTKFIKEMIKTDEQNRQILIDKYFDNQ